MASEMAEAASIVRTECRVCGASFEYERAPGPGRKRRFCSDACKHAVAAQSVRTQACRTCGQQYAPRYGKPAGFCSINCRRYPERRVWETRQEAARAKDYRRRSRKRGVGYERFTRREIFERDKWLCGICGQPTDRSPDAHRNDRPSLDHVVPLAKGGPHTRANTQCAHWLCNSTKGARLAA